MDGVYAGVGEDEGGYEDEGEGGEGDEDGGEGANVSESRRVMSQAPHCPPRGWNLTLRKCSRHYNRLKAAPLTRPLLILVFDFLNRHMPMISIRRWQARR